MHAPVPRSTWLAVATVLLLAACDTGDQSPTGPEAPEIAAAATSAEPAADDYIVVFKSEVKDVPGAARRLAAREKAELRHTHQPALRGFSARMSAAAAKRLAADPLVAFVEPDQIVRGTAAPAVQLAAEWNLDRIDRHPNKLDQRYGYTSTGAGVTVYVLDSGWGGAEGDLGGSIVTIGNFTEELADRDLAGHGTHVSGTIGSTAYGVAKGAAIRMVKVLDQNLVGTTTAVIRAINLVIADHVQHGGPAVINMSLGAGRSEAVNGAATFAVQMGISVVAAAGNDAVDACGLSPASAPGVLAVGASDRLDRAATFSNYGPCVDLFAPGVDILSTWLSPGGTSSAALSSGTSIAAPHVTGAVARYLSLNPTASPAAVTAAILGEATAGAITFAKVAKKTPNRLLYIDPNK